MQRMTDDHRVQERGVKIQISKQHYERLTTYLTFTLPDFA